MTTRSPTFMVRTLLSRAIRNTQARYCSSLTFSIQSTVLPSSCSTIAMCVMAVVGVAPCQCFSPGRHRTTSPGRNLLDRTAPALHQAAAGRHDQRLTQRMGVPCGPGAWLERHADAECACRFGCLEEGVDAYNAGEVLGPPFAGGL